MVVFAMSWFRSTVGAEPYLDDQPQANSETFVVGDPIMLDTSGQVIIAVDTGFTYGIALEAAANDSNNAKVLILVIQPTDLFTASQSTAGATQNSAQTQVGLKCSYIKSTISDETAKTVIDTADTTTPSCEIVGLDTRQAVATAEGRVVFRFLADQVRARTT